MSKTEKELQDRIIQLESTIKNYMGYIPPAPDKLLAEDEFWAIFSDYRDLTTGTLSKIPWQGGSNMTTTFKVKRVYK